MKPSELRKDAVTCVRINAKIKEVLKTKGKTPQKIVDEYVNEKITIDKDLNVRGK